MPPNPALHRSDDARIPGDLRKLESGLDALQSHGFAPRPWPKRFLGATLAPIGLLVVLLTAWQAGVVIFDPRPDLYPGPLAVISSLANAWGSGRLPLAIETSLQRGFFGLIIAVLIGTPVGLLLAEFRLLRCALGPLISGLQVLPSVAWVPAAIIWFGLSDATVYFVVLMGSVPSIVNGLISGVENIPPELKRVGIVLGASRMQLTLLVILPAALPGYFAGLKQGWAFSWRSLMAAEIIAFGGSIGFGLGSLLQQGRELADLGSVLGTIITILGIGIIVELVLFAPIEQRLLRGRGLIPVGAIR